MSEPSTMAPPLALDGQVIESGPIRVRNENWWQLSLPNGDRAILAQLLPELASDQSLRRRYVYEAERLAALGAPCLAQVLAIGPKPDPRAPEAQAPWRLRREPPGRSLEKWLDDRAPAPVDEALDLVARLADAVHQVHVAGAVLRDLEPRCVILGDGGRIWLVDVGLARLDILSSRTASSLMLENSPYAAPEHLRTTVLDLRADVFTLGVILWRALTGTLPFADRATFVRDYSRLPALSTMRPEAPEQLDGLLCRCLAEDPDERPESARVLADILRGDSEIPDLNLARVPCQACGESLRPGLRLCLSCGREAVRFHHSDADDKSVLFLTKAKEDEEFLRNLRDFFATVGDGPTPELNFLIGDQRMYSREEQKSLRHLPTPLFAGLAPDTAAELAERLRQKGVAVKVESARALEVNRRNARGILRGGLAGAVMGTFIAVAGATVFGLALLGVGAVATVTGSIMTSRARKQLDAEPMGKLRAAPAALPSSDPYVKQMAELLAKSPAPDVHELVGELALHLQRLSDYRSNLSDPGEIEALLVEPLDAATELICREVEAIIRIDGELSKLDEGALIRAIASSEARREPRGKREPFLIGLDRLRELEDLRAAHLQRLLEASALLRRTIELGLVDRGAEKLGENYLALALSSLDGG